jgi:hypothetical protein
VSSASQFRVSVAVVGVRARKLNCEAEDGIFEPDFGQGGSWGVWNVLVGCLAALEGFCPGGHFSEPKRSYLGWGVPM